jgi:hypothetical protein
MGWRSIRENIKNQISDEGRFWIDSNPFPILINRYQRIYFVSRDEKIRITIDTNQAVWDQRFKSKPNFINKANIPDILIVEFKFDRRDREYASKSIQGIPLRVSRHSNLRKFLLLFREDSAPNRIASCPRTQSKILKPLLSLCPTNTFKKLYGIAKRSLFV